MKLSTYVEDRGDDVVVHGWRIAGLLLVVLLVLGAIQFAVWGLGIVTAPWVGRQNVHRVINAPSNQIFQYEHFFTLDADIHADAANLKTEERQAAQHRKDTAGQPDPAGANATEQARLDSVVTGTSAHCQANVQTYNNDAREYTKDTFLSHQLPSSEDPTQCEVTP